MASSITLPILSARDGKTYDLELANDSVLGHVVREEIATRTNIPPDDQIILYGPPFSRVDPRKPLYAYGLPSTSKKIYLYNRRDLTQSAAPPSEEILYPTDIDVPRSPPATSSSSRILSESGSPLMRALADYEQQFLLQLKQGKALAQGATMRLTACANCIEEQDVQEQAVRAAISNLESFQAPTSKRFQLFWKNFQKQAKRQDELLQNFNTDIEKLGQIELHPVLCTDTRRVLLDCIPLEREKQWVEDCAKSHRHLKEKTEELSLLHEKICDGVGVELTCGIFTERKQLMDELEHLKQQAALHEPYTERMEANYQYVTDQVNGASSQLSNESMYDTTNALEACRGLDQLWNEHSDLIPKMMAFDAKLKEFMIRTGKSKSNVNFQVYEHLQRVSGLQSQIRDLTNMLSMLKEAMSEQRNQFVELEHLQRLPESYNACLSEIVRRRIYGRTFSNKIQSMAEELAQLREYEMDQREAFLASFGQHLPREFVPGLAEKPSHCEFRMRPFDQNLPAIDDERFLRTTSPSSSVSSNSQTTGTLVLSANPDWNASAGSDDMTRRCHELESEILKLQKELNEKNKKMAISSTDGYPMLFAMAAAADISCSSEGSSLVVQEECGRAIRQAETYERRIKSLERHLETMGVNPKEVGTFVDISSDKCKELEEIISTLTKEVERKEEAVTKYRIEQQQAALNAASFEKDIQNHISRERLLEQKLNSSQTSINMFQRSNMEYSLLFKSICKDMSIEVEIPSDPAQALSDETKGMILSALETHRAPKDVELQLRETKEKIMNLKLENESMKNCKISFRDFEVNDLALFLPTAAPGLDRGVYLAFNIGCSDRYLSEESISSFRGTDNRLPPFILGKIVYIDQHTADEDINPYNLSFGATFYILTVASLTE